MATASDLASRATRLYLQGEANFLARKWDEAVNKYRCVLSINPEHGDAHFRLGYSLYMLNGSTHSKETLDSYWQAIEYGSRHGFLGPY